MQRGNYHNPHSNPYHTHQYPPQNPPLNHPIHHLKPPQYPFSPEDETRLRDEVLYLHSLWHRGPPPTFSQTPHFLKPTIPSNFKKAHKFPKIIEPHLISNKEWPVKSTPKSPSPSGSNWPEFKPVSFPVTRPATAEEKEKLLGLRVHLKGLDSCYGLFHKEGGSDDDDDDDGEEDNDGDDAKEYDFLMKVFEEEEELRVYYKKNCENGDFYCLICGVLANNKLVRKYKNCVALIQHSVTVSNTKKRNAHRAYGHVICKVLGWDIHRLPSLPSAAGDGGGQSLEKPQGEVGNHADIRKDIPTVVEREGDFANTSHSIASPKDKLDAIEMKNGNAANAGCAASELTHNESKTSDDGLEVDGRES